jgi:hypothetical protein
MKGGKEDMWNKNEKEAEESEKKATKEEKFGKRA